MRRWSISLVVAAVALAAAAPTAGASVVVGMGDSFAAGQAVPPYDAGTDVRGDTCHRSALSWQPLLGVTPEHHLACSGATTENLIAKGQQRRAPDDVPQLARLRQISGIQRVLVMIGGNDLKFAAIVATCRILSCLRHMDRVELPRLRNSVKPRVASALRKIRAAAGGADVILVGYPDLIATPDEPRVHCRWLKADETARVFELERKLDDTLRAAAGEAHVSFVSIRAALRGHELCTRGSWVHPIDLVGGVEQGHPLQPGQAAIAQAVRRRLDALHRPLTLTTTGVGALRIGRTATTLRRQRLIGPLKRGCELDPGQRVAPLRGRLRGTAVFTGGKRLSAIEVTRGAITSRGIGIGASSGAVLSAYPDSDFVRPGTAPLSGFITVPKVGRPHLMFALDPVAERVTGIATPALPFCE